MKTIRVSSSFALLRLAPELSVLVQINSPFGVLVVGPNREEALDLRTPNALISDATVVDMGVWEVDFGSGERLRVSDRGEGLEVALLPDGGGPARFERSVDYADFGFESWHEVSLVSRYRVATPREAAAKFFVEHDLKPTTRVDVNGWRGHRSFRGEDVAETVKDEVTLPETSPTYDDAGCYCGKNMRKMLAGLGTRTAARRALLSKPRCTLCDRVVEPAVIEELLGWVNETTELR